MSRLKKSFFINIIIFTMNDKSIIAVFDMRAFYSYVECIDKNLDPYTTPLVVADNQRGTNTIVLSITPYLKSKGIPSRLRIKDLPKNIDYIFATPRMERYLQKSSEVFSIILDFVCEDDLHIYSIDEGFIKITPYLKLYKMSACQLIKRIKYAIKEKTGLECTVGLGDNMFLAKIALDNYAKNEKDGIAIITKEDIKEKIWPIYPLSKVWGIGQNLQKKLNYLGIYTMEDLAKSNREFIHKYFGIIGEELIDHANGIDNSDISLKYIPKETSLTSGQTLCKDYNHEDIKLIIRELLDDLMVRLRSENKLCGCVHIYIGYSKRYGGFAGQISLLRHSDDNDIIYDALMTIFNKKCQNFPIRKLSIALSKLKFYDGNEQLDLFIDPKKQDKKRKLRFAIDEIQLKYGKNAILRTSALLETSTIKERHSYIGGHHK